MSSAQQPAETWLDRIPRDWQIIPAKAAFTERRHKSRPTDVHLTPSQKYGVLPQNEYMQISGSKVVLNLEGQDNMKHVEANDFIIHLRSFQGGIEWSDISGKVSMAYTVLTPRGCMISPTYYRWALKADAYIQELRSTTDQLRDGQSIKYATFAKIPLPLPPLDEQRAIADYLDQETAQIDALVAKQEEFIGLLRERRGAFRDNVLTSGINPERGIRATGSTFLPELPFGWRAVPTRRLLSEGPTNGFSPQAGQVGDLRSLSIGAVRKGSVILSDNVTKFIDCAVVKDVPRLRLASGDVLIVRGNGNINLVGRAGLVGSGFDTEEYIYPDLLIRIRTTPDMLPEFFVAAFDSPTSRVQIELLARTTVGTYKVSAADIRSIVLPLPPLDEQLAIIAHINERTARIDALIAKAEEHIALAKERRSALITAAVTGQFDVRTAKKGARV